MYLINDRMRIIIIEMSTLHAWLSTNVESPDFFETLDALGVVDPSDILLLAEHDVLEAKKNCTLAAIPALKLVAALERLQGKVIEERDAVRGWDG